MTTPEPRCQVLMVCSGNTCRSPLAEVILRDLLAEPARRSFRVLSAGTGAVTGAPPSEGARLAAEEEGLSLGEHRARRLTREMITESDLVLTMERSHYEAVLSLDRSAGDRVHLLNGFAAALLPGEGKGIDDPVGGGVERYRSVYDEIRRALERSLPRIRGLAEDPA